MTFRMEITPPVVRVPPPPGTQDGPGSGPGPDADCDADDAFDFDAFDFDADAAFDDGYIPTVIGACQVLGGTDCRFHVAGFGQDPWPVDVSYDLSTLVECLPDALSALRRGQPAELDFYGQGIERTVTLVPDGGSVLLRCGVSRTGWIPDPAVESLPYDAVISMLTRLARDFRVSLERAWPDLAAREPFVHWT